MPPSERPHNSAVEPLRRARGKIHAQLEAQERRNQYVRQRHADGSPAVRPTARAATRGLHGDGIQMVKYLRRGVLHNFSQRDANFRCE